MARGTGLDAIAAPAARTRPRRPVAPASKPIAAPAACTHPRRPVARASDPIVAPAAHAGPRWSVAGLESDCDIAPCIGLRWPVARVRIRSPRRPRAPGRDGPWHGFGSPRRGPHAPAGDGLRQGSGSDRGASQAHPATTGRGRVRLRSWPRTGPPSRPQPGHDRHRMPGRGGRSVTRGPVYWLTMSKAIRSVGVTSCWNIPVSLPSSAALLIVLTIGPGAAAVPMNAWFMALS